MGFVFRLTLLYASIFGAIGVQLPFLPVWLAAKGLDERTIGAVLAVSMVARVAVVPLATRAADQFGNLKAAILLASFAAAASLTLLGFMDHVFAILVMLSLAAAMAGTTFPLVETYTLQGVQARGWAYGPVRAWGSPAFIIGSLVAGLLSAVILPQHLIWVIVAPYWFGVGAALMLEPAATSSNSKPTSFRELLAVRGVVGVLAASSLIQASHAVYYGFSTLQWSAAGLSGITIGILWATGVLAEIVLFVVSGRFPPALQPVGLLAIGAAGGALRWAIMAVDPPSATLPVWQCLHALSFGATHLGAVQFLARAAPPGLAATAQGLLAMANGIMMATAMAAAGWLYAGFGPAAYAPMAVLALGGGAALLTVRRAA